MDKLKLLRTEKGLRQIDVANSIGVDRTTYAKYESGASEPNFDMLQKLTKLFGVSTDYLLGLTNKKKPPEVKDDGRPDALASFSRETKIAMELLARLEPENQIKALDHLQYLLARQEEQEKR